MTQYIDKDAVVAEMERQQRKLCLLSQSNKVELRRDAAIQNGVYCSLLSFIGTLEVKDVDLNEEIEKCLKKHSMLAVGKKDFTDIAKHFFELGLKQSSSDEYKIGESEIYLEDDGGEPPYDGKQWLDISCMEYAIPYDKFKVGDKIEVVIRKIKKGE